MKIKSLTLAVLFSTGMAMQSITQAADTSLAIEQMAEIMLELEAKPGKDAQMTLDDIAKDSSSTNNERLLAGTIKNMDQKIRPDDKPSIMKIWLSPAASETEREMAKILLRFKESPSESSKQALSSWIEK